MLARRPRRTGALTTLVLGAALVTGCSTASGQAGSSSSTPTGATSSPPSAPTSTAPPSPSSTPPSSAAPSASGSASASAGPKRTEVTAREGSFTVKAPPKWVDRSRDFADLDEVRLALRARRADHGTPNITVTSSSEEYAGDAEAAARQAAEKFEQHDAKVTDVPDTEIGGEHAVGNRMLRTINARTFVQLQYFVVHDGRLYAPTGTALPDDEQALQEAMDAVFSSWRWS